MADLELPYEHPALDGSGDLSRSRSAPSILDPWTSSTMSSALNPDWPFEAQRDREWRTPPHRRRRGVAVGKLDARAAVARSSLPRRRTA